MGNPLGDGGAGYNVVKPNGTELIRLIPLSRPNVQTNADYFATSQDVADLGSVTDVFTDITIEGTLTGGYVWPSMDPEVTSTGSTNLGAYLIHAHNTIVVDVPPGTGVILPPGLPVGAVGDVVNADIDNGLLTFYPPTDGVSLVNSGPSVKIPA
jgi:hypothetical protein